MRLGPGVTETRTKVDYYDTTSLDETFGHDRVDKYWDETDGQGALVRADDGTFFHKDHSGEIKEATDDVISSFVEGQDAEDA